MKLIKKLLFAALVLAILAQIPSIYCRIKIGKLARTISGLGKLYESDLKNGYTDLKGQIHVHTSLGGHSTGTFDELIEGAQKAELKFVVLSEHTSTLYDTSKLSLQGIHSGTLFISGNELDTADSGRFIQAPGSEGAIDAVKLSSAEYSESAKKAEKLVLAIYPEKFIDWNANFSGVEVFSLHTNAKRMDPVSFITHALWAYRTYPELTLALHFQRPDAILKEFDAAAEKRKLMLYGAADAHSNIGFHLIGDDAGNKLLNLKLDSYGTIFKTAATHIFVKEGAELSQQTVIDALKNGRTYFSVDSIADPKGFFFSAEDQKMTAISGDEIKLNPETTLKVRSPLPARIKILKNGEVFSDTSDTNSASVKIDSAGVYRVEVFLDQLGEPFESMPWIMSNPIYVR